MKRILIWTGAGLAVAAAVTAAILLLCTCVFGNHRYKSATCTEAETCLRCGITRGEPFGHDRKEATCEAPAVCLRCQERLGDPLGHSFLPADCETPETCTRCGITQGEPLGHGFLPATCTEPETCFRCGLIRGEPLGHDMQAATYQTPAICLRCGWVGGAPKLPALSERDLTLLSVGEPAPYATVSYEDHDVEVVGTVEISDYRVIEGDEFFPPRAGYEWHIAAVRIVFADDDARANGAQCAWTYGDWYLGDNSMTAPDADGLRAFVADWYGARVTCWQKTGSAEEADWYDRELRFAWQEGVLVPKGYDGVLLIFHPYCGTELTASKALDENALVFRME